MTHAIKPTSLTRRETLRLGAAGFMTLATWSLSDRALGANGNELRIATTLGPVRGRRQGAIRAFPGIPYTAANAGIHRFIAPRPATPWTSALELDPAWARSVSDPSSAPERGDDLLRVDVYTAPGSGAPRPVLVEVLDWDLPRVAAAREPEPDPASVVVRVGHRRGPFGFLYLGALIEREFAGSGNAGLLDIVVALRWVRANIAAFGGDPEDVTLAGGDTVACIAALPAARDLFRQARVPTTPKVATPEAADRATRALLKVLEIAPAKARSLQQVPADRLLAVWSEVRGTLAADAAFGPVADDLVLPRGALPTG